MIINCVKNKEEPRRRLRPSKSIYVYLHVPLWHSHIINNHSNVFLVMDKSPQCDFWSCVNLKSTVLVINYKFLRPATMYHFKTIFRFDVTSWDHAPTKPPLHLAPQKKIHRCWLLQTKSPKGFFTTKSIRDTSRKHILYHLHVGLVFFTNGGFSLFSRQLFHQLCPKISMEWTKSTWWAKGSFPHVMQVEWAVIFVYFCYIIIPPPPKKIISHTVKQNVLWFLRIMKVFPFFFDGANWALMPRAECLMSFIQS